MAKANQPNPPFEPTPPRRDDYRDATRYAGAASALSAAAAPISYFTAMGDASQLEPSYTRMNQQFRRAERTMWRANNWFLVPQIPPDPSELLILADLLESAGHHRDAERCRDIDAAMSENGGQTKNRLIRHAERLGLHAAATEIKIKWWQRCCTAAAAMRETVIKIDWTESERQALLERAHQMGCHSAEYVDFIADMVAAAAVQRLDEQDPVLNIDWAESEREAQRFYVTDNVNSAENYERDTDRS